ncbi:hypothetical protein [Micromonospora sp. KC606]|uniref:hypothetical protein n=1 Tax=Micromonospora sp. KC606 TaxID=2530379 RepID=UPI00140489B5|nr:hypothetical protein [Micromonospora sp. KC606]
MHPSHLFSEVGVTNRAALVRRFHLAGLARAQLSRRRPLGGFRFDTGELGHP